MRRTIIFIAVSVALVMLGSALAGTGDTAPQTVSLSASVARVEYGDRVQLAGSVQPVAAAQEIVIEQVSGYGWTELARTTTDMSGAFDVDVVPMTTGSIRARVLPVGAASEAVPLDVVPKVSVKPAHGRAFAGIKVSARIVPSSYAARAVVLVKRDGKTVGRRTARVRHGRLATTIVTAGIGRFFIEVRLPAASGLSETAAGGRLSAQGRTLSSGSSGRDVRELTQRLAALKFHVPGIASTFSSYLTDSVIAFQKAYRLPRTGVVGPETWRKLETANVLEPRYRGPALHIEIDKTRQILMVVRGDAVRAVLPVSTGATGNTPEGRHQIRWKALSTTTWLGSGILYRTMTFYGNSFAIHGWYSVPSYPASHGCVRIPIWTADWLYNQSPVGETVYVYH